MRYLKQHPDLPTVECETCEGVPQQEGWADDGDGPEPNGSWWDCPACKGTGRASPYWPMIGDEVEWHRAPGAGTGIVVGVFASDDFPLILEPSQAGQGGRASVEAVALIKPCLDTPERQALQEKLEK